MFGQLREMAPRGLGVLIAFMSVAWAPTALCAGSIPVVLANEAMSEYMASDLVLIGFFSGIDPLSPLSFTSDVDPAGRSFSYSLLAGSMYNGQQIIDLASGTLNGTTWTLSSTGSLGSTVWSTSGTMTINYNAGNDTDTDTQDLNRFDKDKVKTGDVHTTSTSELTAAGGTVMDKKFLTDKNGDKIPGSDKTSEYALSAAGAWNLQVFGSFTLTSSGISPPDGGAGTFSVSLVPEPSSSILLFLGSSVVGVCLWKRHRI
jgi:hypothetical protein